MKIPQQGEVIPFLESLKGILNPEYPPWDLRTSDNKRIDVWLKEFRKYEQDGKLPQLSIIQLPSDHTAGASPGYPTPRAMVAENDNALGRMVEIIFKKSFLERVSNFCFGR